MNVTNIKARPDIAPWIQLMIGKKFGMLTVVSFAGSKKRPITDHYVFCNCDCGTRDHLAEARNVRFGRTQSCGCLMRKVVANGTRTTHGFGRGGKKRSKIYAIWGHMIQRCHTPSRRDFARYGGRGIRVCDRWRGKGGFLRFLADMGERPDGMSLERIDNDQGYNKNNCKWIPLAHQSKNRSMNWHIEVDGKALTAADACRKVGIDHRGITGFLRSIGAKKSKVYRMSDFFSFR